MKEHIEGVIKFNLNGSARFSSDEYPEGLYIDKKYTKNALHLDTVRCAIQTSAKGYVDAKVEEVVTRFKTEFIGTIQVNKRHAFMVPDSNKIVRDFFIPKTKLNGAEDGKKVVVQLTHWDEGKNPKGKVLRVLGDATDHNTVIHSILEEYGLPYEFDADVIAESEAIPLEIPESEIAKRKDMRNVLTMTIDPDTAQDFDDALSVEWVDGQIRVGVHIADVTHYLKENTLLDKEAFRRGTSVYLVDRCVPMLPERLSNGLCSLRPNEDKLTFSAIFTLDRDGKIIDEWFGKTIINSNKRFTYEEAQALLDDKRPIAEILDEIHEDNDKISQLLSVKALDRYAKILRKARTKSDAIVFNKKEAKFELDEAGKPIGLFFKEMKDSNQLIEEFMLLANRRVAYFVNKMQKGIMVQRSHDRPNLEKLTDLANYLTKFGYTLDLKDTANIAQNLNKLLVEVKGSPEENVISNLVIRTMAKAFYSTKNIGHYGLGFEDYAHFTSPIRRYPDVMAHRLLEMYLKRTATANPAKIEVDCSHLSERERLAQKAQRASIKYKQAEYLSTRIGEIFKGVISSVQDFGFFIEMEDNGCEGLLRTSGQTDKWVMDTVNYQGTRRCTGQVLRLGDEVMVSIKGVDMIKKEIDLAIV